MRNYNLIATSLEQSRQLMDAGLSLSTADMTYNKFKACKDDYYFLSVDDKTNDESGLVDVVPAWSLSALIELMPKIKTEYGIIRPKMVKEETSVLQYRFYYETLYFSEICETAVDAAVDMVLWLIREGFLIYKK